MVFRLTNLISHRLKLFEHFFEEVIENIFKSLSIHAHPSNPVDDFSRSRSLRLSIKLDPYKTKQVDNDDVYMNLPLDRLHLSGSEVTNEQTLG